MLFRVGHEHSSGHTQSIGTWTFPRIPRTVNPGVIEEPVKKEKVLEPARKLSQKVNRGEIVTGLLATFHLWPGLVEIAMRAGVDYLIIDREHGPHSDELTAEVCAVGRRNGFPVLIRPVDTEYATLRRTVDLGPCGVLLPTVESTDQLDRVQSAVRLPPRGRRRPGGAGNLWVSGYDYPSWKDEFEDDLIVLPQIESREGLERVESIAAHEITTAIAIGPYDLSADLGVCSRLDAPEVIAAETRIREAGRLAGKQMWHIGDPAALRSRGFTFLCIGEPTVMLETMIRNTRASAEKNPPAATA